MPSQITHLAIAKRFLEKHKKMIKDVQGFLDGNVLPDLHPDKAVSHCGVRTEINNIVKYNAEKVNPAKFATTHDLSDDLNKGQYLHLYVDYQYYNVFLADYVRKQTVGKQMGIDMFETSRRDDQYLRQKYGVAYSDSSLEQRLIEINDDWDQESNKKRIQPGYHYVFPYDFVELDEFIEKMSEITIPN